MRTRATDIHATYFQSYMGAKRKALVARIGYDSRNACHAIRLMRMRRELLETGTMNVWRTTDVDELRAIKRGEWSLDQVKSETAREATRSAEAHAQTSLPESVGLKYISALLADIQLEWYAQRRGVPPHDVQRVAAELGRPLSRGVTSSC